MNEEDHRRFEYLYPIYLASLNNKNSSATEETSNFIKPEFSDGEEAFQYYSFYKSENSKKWKAWYESHRQRPCEHTTSSAYPYDEEEEQSYNSYYQNSLDYYSWKPEYNYNPLYEWSCEEEDPWFNHKCVDDYSWKPEYDYNPLYEWICEEEDAWFSNNSQNLYNSSLNDTIVELQASMVINCEMMKDLLIELKEIKQELSKLSGQLGSSQANDFPLQQVNEALISNTTFHNFDEVSVTSTYSGENFKESSLPSTCDGYHTDVVPTLFIEKDDTTAIQNETLSHSIILSLILDEKKYYHTDVIDKAVEEIRKLFSLSHLPYFLYDLDKDHFLFPENVTNASIFETQDKRKFIFDTG
ncbi:hypothetical protein CsatB_016847 [Cannabis sativa]